MRSIIPIIVVLLFIAVAVISFQQVSATQKSIDAFQSNILNQSATISDSSLASSIVAYTFSEYLRGEDVEDELRNRVNALNAQLRLGNSSTDGKAGEHVTAAKKEWESTKPKIISVLDGNDDPELTSEILASLEQIRIDSKRGDDSWVNEVLTVNLNNTQIHLVEQKRLFSIFAPIAGIGAVVLVVFAFRSRHQARLEIQNEQLAKVNDEKTQFVSQVSHELKTPLTSVIAFTDLLIGKSDVPLSNRQDSHLKIVKRNAEYLKLLVDDLVDVSQLETGHIDIDPQSIQLNAMLVDLQTSFGPIVERKNQKLIIEEIPQNVSVYGDRLRLLQLISNLIGNATKYSDPSTVITVTHQTCEDAIEISVEDEGEGIPDSEKVKAFEMFYRGTAAATKGESGTGIGLAVSKMIVDAHKGSIAIEDADPIGTRVVVTLPCAPSVDAHSVLASASAN